MRKKVGQEVAHARLLAQIAVGIGEGDKSWTRSMSNIWNSYVRAMYYKEAEYQDLEKDMAEEYRKFSHLRPKITLTKEGAVVSGIPNN